MCGFCGVVTAEDRLPISEGQLIAMRDSMHHRGPDDCGSLLAPHVALGSRRLAILDLSPRGHMPMSTPDGRFTIVYNGEVYNYRELRPALEARGIHFDSNCDTEVVLKSFADEGPAMLSRFNGMFGIAIWDAQEQSLFLARDRVGVKPVYYAVHNNALYFASEEKALFAAGVPAQFDANKWEELLCFRFTAGEETPFVGVKRLLPGHYLVWKNGKIEIKRWWNLAERAWELQHTALWNPVEWYRDSFDSAISLRRISDVPVGVLLSGGLDSSIVAATLGHQGARDVACFTMRFAEQGYDEGPLAQQVAEKWGLKFFHRTLPTEEFLSRQREASWYQDEPLVHGNDAHLWTISELAKPEVTVLLSGEGADEVLGGYIRYQPLRWPRTLEAGRGLLSLLAGLPKIGPRVEKLNRFMNLGPLDRMVLFNCCDILPDDLSAVGFNNPQPFPYREQVLAEAKRLYPSEPMRQVMYSDQHTFLQSLLDRNDRMTMAASIECRVPFLDYRLVERTAALRTEQMIHGKRGKWLARQALGNRLPESILKHRKWGFGVPWSKYFREVPEFRELLTSLPDQSPVSEGPFERRKISKTIDDFLAGDNRLQTLLRQMLLVTIWHETYFPRARAAAKGELVTPRTEFRAATASRT